MSREILSLTLKCRSMSCIRMQYTCGGSALFFNSFTDESSCSLHRQTLQNEQHPPDRRCGSCSSNLNSAHHAHRLHQIPSNSEYRCPPTIPLQPVHATAIRFEAEQVKGISEICLLTCLIGKRTRLQKATTKRLTIQKDLNQRVEELCHIAELHQTCNSGPEEPSRLGFKIRETELSRHREGVALCFGDLIAAHKLERLIRAENMRTK